MSQENVEVVRAVYERWGKGDFRAAVDLFAPHVVLVVPPREFFQGGAYLGAEEIERYTRRELLQSFAEVTMEAEELIEAGDSVIVAVTQRGVGRASRAPTEGHFFAVWSFRGPKVIRIESFGERAEALEAAGLRE